MTSTIYDALDEAREFREQLASDRRRTAFLFGAGTSQAVGLDGIVQLTAKIPELLSDGLRPSYERVLKDLGSGGTVEGVLDRVRLYRELLGDTGITDRVSEISGSDAMRLDCAICKAIFERINVDPPNGLTPYVNFGGWVGSIARSFPVEIFTTNYDVLIERGLEQVGTPHFDGFVGSYSPTFSPASVDAELGRGHDAIYPPPSWVRVWKLHGSIGWRTEVSGSRTRIVRVPHRSVSDTDDLMIYPSRQKYADSRKQPYIAYHDRLRRLLLSGEVLLITAGYSFGDQHINEIIFEAMRMNNRLSVTALMYGDLQESLMTNLLKPTQGCRNLTMYCADYASVSGTLGKIHAPTKPPIRHREWPFWNSSTGRFTLGDFASFSDYLRIFLGAREQVGLAESLPENSGGPNWNEPGELDSELLDRRADSVVAIPLTPNGDQRSDGPVTLQGSV